MFTFFRRKRARAAGRKQLQLRRLNPRLERLEDRCLLSASIVDFTISGLESYPFGITSGPDGNVWFTEESANQIANINPITHAMSGYVIPTAHSDPVGITTGPDGEIWFTEQTANQIGALNLSTGGISEYPITTAGSLPVGIAAGSDGNIWFAEQNGNQIGMFDLATDAITEYGIPTSGSKPTAIIPGPDGNLWFTEADSDQIGTINPATHVFTQYTIPNGGDAYGITVGPQGNLWFTEPDDNCIGEVNLATKAISLFPIPVANSGAQAITAGSDGQLWLAESNANMIGAFNPANDTFSELSIPVSGAEPGWISAGPGGTMWFTETTNQPVYNQIGEIVAPPTITTAPVNQTIIAGQTATFRAAAITGMPAPGVFWEVSTNGGLTFARLQNGGVYSGTTTGKLTITGATTAMSGYEFQAVFNNGIGPSVTTSPVTLTVHGLLWVPAFPQGTIGTDYSQTVAVAGSTTPLTVVSATNFNGGGTGLTADDISTDLGNGTITVRGTPTAAGTATFTLAMANTAGISVTQNVTITVRPPLSIATQALPQADAGTKYLQAINIIGGALPYETFSVTNFDAGGTGLTARALTALPATGVFQINGTPTRAGAATFAVDVVDTTGMSVTQSYTITVNPVLTVAGTLPPGTAGTNYSQVVTAAGGSTPYTSVTVSYFSAGTTGLNIGDLTTNAAAGTCAIDGTPTAAGTFSFTVNVVDAIGAVASKTYSVTINRALEATPSLLPQGTAGAKYHQTITITGGTRPYTGFTITGFTAGTTGLSAAGIVANSKTGTIIVQGAPTGAGTASFTVTVTDDAGSVLTRTFDIAINPTGTKTPPTSPLSIETSSLPQTDVGKTYNQSINVVGGVLPYATFSVTNFNGGGTGLTAGEITALKATGAFQIHGTPTAAGTVTFAVKVRDADDTSVTQSYTIAVNSALIITPSLPEGTARTVYDQTLTVSGGGAPYASITVSQFSAGTTGLNIGAVTTNAAAGTCTINGTPTAAGTFTFTVNAVDATGIPLSKTYRVRINPALTITPVLLPPETAGVAFHQTITVAGGTRPFATFTVTGFSGGGTGLTANAVVAASAAGKIIISGTPTGPGTVAFTVNVTDATLSSLTRTYSFTINPALTIGSLSATQWSKGAFGFSGTLSISDGTAPFSIASYTGLPTGLMPIISGNTISFAGIPNAAHTFAHGSVTIQDAAGSRVTSTFSITINPALYISALTGKRQWTAGQSGFPGAMTVGGGTGGRLTVLTSSGLPTGLSLVLSGNTLSFTGTPATPGTYAAQVIIRDSVGVTVTGTFTVIIDPVPSISEPSRTQWTADKSGFTATMTISGGTGPLQLTSVSGLPTGLKAAFGNLHTLTITGTPTAPGTYTASITIQDAAGASVTRSLDLTINPPLSITTSLPAPSPDVPYVAQVQATGGTGTITYAVTAGRLPLGLELSSTGSLSGTAKVLGSSTFTITARDATGAKYGKTYTLAVSR